MASDDVAALHRQAVAAQEAGDYLTLVRLGREIVESCERSGDAVELAWGHYFIAAASFQRNDGSGASRAYRRARELFEAAGVREGVVRSMLGLAAVSLDIDQDANEARRLYDLCLPIVREMGDKRRLAIVLGNLGEIHRSEGALNEALRCANEAVALFRESGDPAFAGWQLTSIGHYQGLRRNYAAAIQSMHASWEELSKNPIPRWIAWYFDIWFILAASLERWEVAAELLGFVNAYRGEMNAPRMQGILPWFSLPVERLSANLSADRLQELLDRGERLGADQAQALAATISAP